MRRTKGLAACLAVCMTVASGCAQKKENIDGEALLWLNSRQTADVPKVLEEMESVVASREAEVEASVAESEAAASREEESSRAAVASSIAESHSVEVSIQESIKESIAISQYYVESEAESRLQEALEKEEAEKAESLRAERESIAASVAEESRLLAESASIQESLYVAESIAASVAESQSIAASLAEKESRPEGGGKPDGADEYLAALTKGTNLVPYGVADIKDSDLYILHDLFSRSVVIGDSRVEGAIWVLAQSEVFYSRGAHSATLHDTARNAAKMYPEKALFWLGLNDMGIYGADVEKYIKDYVALIEDFLSVSPKTKIYVQNMTPVGELGISKYPNAVYSDAYSQAIAGMCAAHGWTFLDGNRHFDPKYYASDGLHYDKKYYTLWVQDAALQMGLWDDKVYRVSR